MNYKHPNLFVMIPYEERNRVSGYFDLSVVGEEYAKLLGDLTDELSTYAVSKNDVGENAVIIPILRAGMSMSNRLTKRLPKADVDMDKVIRMCIIHDLGECFTGDIPTFDKKQVHEDIEENLLFNWIDTLPSYYAEEMKALYNEMTERKTVEAKIYKAIDSLEALIQHNASDLSTWIPKEYKLNLTYADDRVSFSEYLTTLRQAIREDTLAKIEK